VLLESAFVLSSPPEDVWAQKFPSSRILPVDAVEDLPAEVVPPFLVPIHFAKSHLERAALSGLLPVLRLSSDLPEFFSPPGEDL